MAPVRVAVIQAPATNSVKDNLARVLRLLDEAGALEPRPAFVTLPEFINHLSWYSDHKECFDTAVDLSTNAAAAEGEEDPTKRFLADVASKAKQHQFYVHLNCTVRREGTNVTGTNIMIDPAGKIVGTSDKQILMGHENDHLVRSTEPGAVVETPFGRVGMYCCMDGVISEPPRALALRGCHILSNSLNSFGIDEGTMHVPVRAAENRVWVLAANKCGPLIPEFLMDPVSAATSIPKKFLCGAGDAQIVAPDGTVIAHAKTDGEEIVVADIDPEWAVSKKVRPDGTDVFASRRPEIYAPLYGAKACAEAKAIADAEDAATIAMMKAMAAAEAKKAEEKAPAAAAAPPAAAAAAAEDEVVESNEARPDLKVGAWIFSGADQAALLEEAVGVAVPKAAEAGLQFLVLPELFCFPGSVLPEGKSAEDAAKDCAAAVEKIAAQLKASSGQGLRVVTSVVTAAAGGGFQNAGVLIGAEGVELTQPQLHACARHAAWTTAAGLGSEQLVSPVTVQSGATAVISLVVGDDAVYPETVRLAALQGAELVLAPVTFLEAWEVEVGLRERAAENRVAMVAASHTAGGTEAAKGVSFNLPSDFTIMTPWKVRKFDGYISFPDQHMFKATGAGLQCVAPVCLENAKNKVISRRTHLLGHRPYTAALVEPLVSAATYPVATA